MEDKKRFKANSKYFTISVYCIFVILVGAVIVKAIFFWSATSAAISNLLSVLSPFFMGLLVAFLINPFVNWIRLTVLTKWCHIKNKGLTKLLAIFFAYIIVLSALTLVIVYLVPEIIDSLTLLLNQSPKWASSVRDFFNGLSDKYPGLQFKYIDDMLNNANSTLQSSLSDLIKALTSTIVVTGVSIVKFIFDLIIAIIISCYLLIDKKVQTRGIKRVVYAFFKKENAERIEKIVRHSVNIFSNFFDGKMIDSLIIGILCFISMMLISLFGVEGFASSALLISIVVGITNMIPYFGPFIGGIPCVLLLSIYSLNSGLVFAILIIVLQQLDGNVIGPKILGDSTGLRPLWIIFAITVGGWVGGVAGMLLGVPCVAVISGLLEEAVDEKLEEKEITNMPVLKNEKVRNNSGSEIVEDKEKKPSILKNLFKK